MGRTKNKEKFRHGKKKKIYSKEIQMKMKELEEKEGERDLIELIEEMSLNEKVRLKIFSTLTYFLGLNASS